jgi:hypothetical protein
MSKRKIKSLLITIAIMLGIIGLAVLCVLFPILLNIFLVGVVLLVLGTLIYTNR